MTMKLNQHPPEGEAAPAHDGQRRRWKLADLVGSAREVVIEHDGQDYLLRITSKGKLILTK
ncbi:MAG: hemin uptake protein HemP [Hyphomicrobiaceae bacterium]